MKAGGLCPGNYRYSNGLMQLEGRNMLIYLKLHIINQSNFTTTN